LRFTSKIAKAENMKIENITFNACLKEMQNYVKVD